MKAGLLRRMCTVCYGMEMDGFMYVAPAAVFMSIVG